MHFLNKTLFKIRKMNVERAAFYSILNVVYYLKITN